MTFGSEMGAFANAITVGYTLVEADPGQLLTKRVWGDEHGALAKQAAANPVRGTFTDIAHTGTAEEILGAYANVLRSLTPHQAIIAARLPSPLCSDGGKWRLTTKNAPEPGALPRSQTTFQPVAGPALLSLDFDIPHRAETGNSRQSPSSIARCCFRHGRASQKSRCWSGPACRAAQS